MTTASDVKQQWRATFAFVFGSVALMGGVTLDLLHIPFGWPVLAAVAIFAIAIGIGLVEAVAYVLHASKRVPGMEWEWGLVVIGLLLAWASTAALNDVLPAL